jgi:two-component system sensor histidine kinase ChiS
MQTDGSETNQNAGIEAIRRCINGDGKGDLGIVALMRADGSLCEAQVYLSIFNVEEESICLLILRKSEGLRDRAGAKNIEHSIGIIEAINQNRLRLQSIKTSLNGLLPLINDGRPEFLNELKAIDESLDNAGRSLLNDENFQSRRHLAVEVMNCSLEYWTESTGFTKAELAHQSRLWKVYTNLDGWERTQTLDRFLNIDTFPRKPNWIKVFKTAEFVLAIAEKPSALRTRLEILLTKLRVSK